MLLLISSYSPKGIRRKHSSSFLGSHGSTASLEHILFQQPLTEWTPLPNPRTEVEQCKRNRDTRKTGEPKYRSSPRNPKFRIKRIRSEREQRSSNAPHDHRGCQCTGRVDSVCVGDICQQRDEKCLVAESEH